MDSTSPADPTASRRQGRIIAVAVIVLAVFSILWFFALPWIDRTLKDQLLIEPDVETDSALMEQTEDRLRQMVSELQLLPTPVNAKARDAEQHGCGTDSGDVFQPWALRAWEVTPSTAAAAAAAVAEALRAKGWTGPSSPDRFGQYVMSAERGEWSAGGVVMPTFDQDEVFVEVRVRGAEPCRLASR